MIFYKGPFLKLRNKTEPGTDAELAYRADTRVKTVCTILDENGTELKNEVWERKVEE